MKFICKLFILLSVTVYGQNNLPDTIKNRKIDSYAKFSNDSLQGKQFFDFNYSLLTGEKFKLSEHKGKVIFLNFWFIGCAPCMGEIPELNKIYTTFKDSNVIMLSLSPNSIEQLNKFISGKKYKPIEQIKYPIVPNSKKIENTYNIYSHPTTILIDKKGIVRLVHSGTSMQSLKNYIAFYGDKGLSKNWKKILKEHSKDDAQIDMSQLFSELISDLLKEE